MSCSPVEFNAFTGNLTCNASDANYKTVLDYPGHVDYGYNCTQLAWYARGHPNYFIGGNNLIQNLCVADGRTAAYRIEFELQSCSQGNDLYYTWSSYHSCCSSKFISLV